MDGLVTYPTGIGQLNVLEKFLHAQGAEAQYRDLHQYILNNPWAKTSINSPYKIFTRCIGCNKQRFPSLEAAHNCRYKKNVRHCKSCNRQLDRLAKIVFSTSSKEFLDMKNNISKALFHIP